MAEAIEFHLEGLRSEGLPIPKPSIIAHQEVTVDLPAA
jgi:predicted RNase H-like HicB family nuclease